MRPSFWKMNEIIDIVRDGEKKTAICIGRDDFGLPKHLMQGTKQDGIISDGHSLSSWYWDGLCVIEGMRYVYFSPCDIRPIYDISTYSRPKALKIVRNLAFALSTAKEDYLDLITGIFPLYRIWIYGEDSILIMPPDLGDLIGIMRDEETKENEVNRIIQGTAEKQFLLITEMAELLYYAATGIFPFASDEVRGSGYREVPVSYFEKLPEKTEGFISFIFHAKSREMRDIMGNGSGGECLGWFLSKSRHLEWNLPPRTEEERDASIKKTRESEAYSTYFAERTRIYKRNTFWRTKGTAIGIVAVIVLLVGGFLASYLHGLLEPPTTKDLDKAGVIEAFYEAQSNCDPSELTTAVKGFSPPQEMEVTNLYVSTRTRFAYESYDPFVNAEEWVNEGMPAVPEGSMIYGVVLESLEETEENHFIATGIWYLPFPEDDSTQIIPPPGTIAVYTYRVTQTFEMKWNDRGWWNIVGSEITGHEYLDTVLAQSYTVERKI